MFLHPNFHSAPTRCFSYPNRELPSLVRIETRSMDPAKFETLRDLLVNEKDFAKTWEFFLDNFAENAEFIENGKRTESPLLEAVIGQVGQQLTGNATIKELLLVSVPGQGLIHGGCIVGTKIANLIYFEDVQSGLIAIPWSIATGETKYARFSTRMLPRPDRGSPSLN